MFPGYRAVPEETARMTVAGRAAYLAEDLLSDAMPFGTGAGRNRRDADAVQAAIDSRSEQCWRSVAGRGYAQQCKQVWLLIQQSGSSAPNQPMYSRISCRWPKPDCPQVDAGTERLAELTREFVAAHRDQLNALLESAAVQEELLWIADGFRDSSPDRARAIRDTVKNGF
jgi:hypothetical protein